jgi:hypothetical protein
MTIDLESLWDFSHPELSEQRFRCALPGASADDAFILQTQIARSYGLRRDFATAQSILQGLESRLPMAGAEARVRYALELGRSLASATHPEASQTADTRERARRAYLQATELAKAENLDALAVDAMHMLAFVDTAPCEQIEWARKALAVAGASSQPQARKWEASLHNNIGCGLHQLGRFEEALQEFHVALALRERAAGANPDAVRVARWMVAWTLRSLNRIDDALAIQERLESEWDMAGTPDPYVFEELAHLHEARGDSARAQHYRQRAGAGSS